jgi:hypothetical protein
MITETLYQNEILFTVPAGLKELSARKLELDRITDGEPAVMSALYLALADEFEQINYTTVAGNCRKRAEYWRLMRSAVGNTKKGKSL